MISIRTNLARVGSNTRASRVYTKSFVGSGPGAWRDVDRRVRSCTDNGETNRDDKGDRFELSEMVDFIKDRVLGDIRRSVSRPSLETRPDESAWVASGLRVDAEHTGVISSDVRRALADIVTDLDTRDAMEACVGVEGELEKAECFVTFGVSPEADMWFSVVRIEVRLAFVRPALTRTPRSLFRRCIDSSSS